MAPFNDTMQSRAVTNHVVSTTLMQQCDAEVQLGLNDKRAAECTNRSKLDQANLQQRIGLCFGPESNAAECAVSMMLM